MSVLTDRKVDITGNRYSRLVAVEYAGVRGALRTWKCVCDCGRELVVPAYRLKNGHTRSCGCLQRDTASRTMRQHGLTRTPEYAVWSSIVDRCCNQGNKSYVNYGGRGIRLCSRWRASAGNLFDDIGLRPSSKHTIERIDNDGNYSCGRCAECVTNEWKMNCRWATRREQNVNKRSNRNYELNGETRCIAEWARAYGISSDKVRYRLNAGWTIEKALGLK